MGLSNFEKVLEFGKAFEVGDPDCPTIPSRETLMLRYRLMLEELSELSKAYAEHDMVEVADALADILYVVYGTAAASGIDIDMIFGIVHESNMSKLVDGKPEKDPTGKIVKGPDYWSPEIEIMDFLNTQ